MKKKWFPAIMCALALLAFLAGAVSADLPAFSLAWWTTDSGGTSSRGGNYVLNSSVAQPDAGMMVASHSYRLEGGFWLSAAPDAVQKYIYVPAVRR